MSTLEVPQPIINSPYAEPAEHWVLVEGESPRRASGRRPACYKYHPPSGADRASDPEAGGTWIELLMVNRIRERVRTWRAAGWPGVTRTTLQLLQYWRREGRLWPLFFAQLEAAETIIFLVEAREDFRQGVDVPWDEPSPERQAEGIRPFRRHACKMATGTGKTTVMGMLCAWSILNKVHARRDARFSDAVLVVCPNVTIRSRLDELRPERGEGSIYRKLDLVPAHHAADLGRGRVLVMNWHVFEPQSVQVAGVSARVLRAGRAVRTRETVTLGAKTMTARGKRYLSLEDYRRQVAAGLLTIVREERSRDGSLARVEVESVRHVESDASVVARVLGRDLGGKRNLLVLNDEAHHAYRIGRAADASDEDVFEDEDEATRFAGEATVWVEGLDRIHAQRGINMAVDLSATPYFLARCGNQTNRPFPWVVSDFGLNDAIESGLVKIPQLAVRDTTGAEIPGYFNIWRWILPRLTAAERGGARGSVKPEAVLKWANTPIALLAGTWEQLRQEWAERRDDPRPPVFIVVCKNTRIAKLVHEWLGEDRPPPGIPKAHVEGFRNVDGQQVTIRVDSKVVHETDTGEAKSDESRWMRLTLDTVGLPDWPRDAQGRPLRPDGFEALAEKLGRPLHPPGRDVRCIVSVGMLTEGWDCRTVTHVVGLRPFMSQLLCEQVVGRALRRVCYEVGSDGLMVEEVAKVLGVPFDGMPLKENRGARTEVPERLHVHALPERAHLAIRFPRVEGYQQAIRSRIAVDWEAVPTLVLDPLDVPPEVELKAFLPNNRGRTHASTLGRASELSLAALRGVRREQAVVMEIATALTRDYCQRPAAVAAAHVLFPQLARLVERFVRERVRPVPPWRQEDVLLSPYFGWAVERLLECIRPDASAGEAPEIPRYEASRPAGTTADVDFWTSRSAPTVERSHLNRVVADTKRWEQSAAYFLDRHDDVGSFVKNAGLGFAIPYLHDGQAREYYPDFIVRERHRPGRHLVLEVKGHDPLAGVKAAAAHRWAAAVNADGSFGTWAHAVATHPADVVDIVRRWAAGP